MQVEQLKSGSQQAGEERVEGLPALVQEKLDLPCVRLGPAIARDQILVVAKMSTLQWEQRIRGVSEEQMVQFYQGQGESGRRVISSHLAQQQVLEDLTLELDSCQVVPIQTLSREHIDRAGLVIALGGDDHFKLITHWIDDERPVVAINSDPQFSDGFLTSGTAADLPQLLDRVERGEYRLEPWTRLRLEVDGRDIGPALGEVVLAKQDFRLMSRHVLEYNGQQEIQKSSGILISTGAGSTGWFTSAGLYLEPEGRAFERTELRAGFELREPKVDFETNAGVRRAVLPKLVQGELLPGQSLVITSLNNSNGIASRDSIDTVAFERGSVAIVRLDSKPLWVISSDFRQRIQTH